MKRKTEKAKIPVEVEYTEGYQERFTSAILKIYAKRRAESEAELSDSTYKEEAS